MIIYLSKLNSVEREKLINLKEVRTGSKRKESWEK